jgi:hypothetical protein
MPASMKLGRPEFIPDDVFRAWLKPPHMEPYVRIAGIQPAGYIAREERLGRPIRSIGSPATYRLLDVVARARANAHSIEPNPIRAGESRISQLRAEEAAVRASIERAKHELSMDLASIALTNATLLREADIVAGATPYAARCGIYFLVKYERVMYVGQSINVDVRLRDHEDRFDFDSVAYIPCDRSILDKMESLYIHFLRPAWNGQIDTANGKLPVAPLSLAHLLGGQGGESMASIKAQAYNKIRAGAST